MNSEQRTIFIKTITGKSISINVGADETILKLKENISEEEGIPVQKIKLIFAGKILEDDQIVSNCNIQAESTVTLAIKKA
jgi:hypothetical protein